MLMLGSGCWLLVWCSVSHVSPMALASCQSISTIGGGGCFWFVGLMWCLIVWFPYLWVSVLWSVCGFVMVPCFG